MYLVVKKGTDEKYGKFAAVYQVETQEEAAKLAGASSNNLHHQIKGTGRWDSENLEWAVFPAEPDWATETD